METDKGLKTYSKMDGTIYLHVNPNRWDECLKYISENNITHIALTPASYGCNGKDLSFLESICDKIEGLNVQSTRYDYGIINKFHNLKELKIEDNGRDFIDFNNFPQLESCTGFELKKRFMNVEKCKKLKELNIEKYKSKEGNIEDIPYMPTLVHLGILYTNIRNLCGINRFKELKYFALYRAHKLESIDDIVSLSDVLEQLDIEGKTKVRNYQALGKLRAIKTLRLTNVGEIETLAFLQTMPTLSSFSFLDSNVLDGNMSYCKKIKWVGFTNKKHYSMTVEELNPEIVEAMRRFKELPITYGEPIED